MDLLTTSVNLKKSMFSDITYNRRLANNLKRVFNEYVLFVFCAIVTIYRWVKFWEGSTDIDFAEIMAAKSVREIDERLTAKVWGYAGVEEYYADASPFNHINKVSISKGLF